MYKLQEPLFFNCHKIIFTCKMLDLKKERHKTMSHGLIVRSTDKTTFPKTITQLLWRNSNSIID